jgi:hypothetical protein
MGPSIEYLASFFLLETFNLISGNNVVAIMLKLSLGTVSRGQQHNYDIEHILARSKWALADCSLDSTC